MFACVYIFLKTCQYNMMFYAFIFVFFIFEHTYFIYKSCKNKTCMRTCIGVKGRCDVSLFVNPDLSWHAI